MFTTLLLAVFSEAYAGTVVFQPSIDKGNSQKKNYQRRHYYQYR